MDAEAKQRLAEYLSRLEDLQVRDLVHSDRADVRMGTFIQGAAFIDALALAYSHRATAPGGGAARWRRFVSAYFPLEYAPVARAYKGFRCLLLHNFSAASTLGFTHGEPDRHLQVEDGRVILNRESFVGAVVDAFRRFRDDVAADEVLGERVLAWLDMRPPVGFWVAHPQTHSLTPTEVLHTASLSGAAWTRAAPEHSSASLGQSASMLQMDDVELSTDRRREPAPATSSSSKKRKRRQR